MREHDREQRGGLSSLARRAMRRWGRLALALVLSLVTAGLALDLRRQWLGHQQTALEHTQLRAAQLATHTAERLGVAVALLDRLEAAQRINPLDSLAIAQTLQGLEPGVAAVVLTESDGRVQAAGDSAAAGSNWASEPVFWAALADTELEPRVYGQQLVTGAAVLGRARRDEEGAFLGVAAIVLGAQYFDLGRPADTQGRRWRILDADGRVVRADVHSGADELPDLSAIAEVRSVLVPLDRPWQIQAWIELPQLRAEWRASARLGLILCIALALVAALQLVQALLALRRRYRGHQQARLLQASNEGLIGIDALGLVRFADPAFARRCRRPPGELIGRELASYLRLELPADDPQTDPLKELLRGQRSDYRGPGRMLLGDQEAVRVTLTPTREGEAIVGALVAVSDSGAVAAPDSEQAAAERLYRTLFELSPDGILIVDLETERPLAFNMVAAQQLGYSDAEFTALGIREHEVAQPALSTIRHIAQVLAEGRVEFQTRYRSADGAHRDVYVVAQVIEFQARPALYWIVRDITERKRAQDRLAEARDQAELANRARSEFLANMSHEIRTPMTAILGLVYLLQKSGLDAVQRDYSLKIDSAARTLLAILDDLLDYAKLEAGRISIERKVFQPRELFDEIGVIFAPLARDKHIDFRIECDPGVPQQALGDPVRLRQVLLNLVGNAVKFTDTGAVSLRAVLRDPDPNQEGAEPELAITVRDTGIGIDAEKLARIFDAFYQVETSTTRRFGGTGLGLPITRRLLDLMQARIDVDSMPGSGSEFRIALPLTPVAATSVDAPQRQPGDLAVVVEDDHTVAEVLRSMLGGLHWQVQVYHDAESVFSALADGQIQAGQLGLLVVDLSLPGIDGVELLRRLYPDASARPLVLVLSAHGLDTLNAALAALPDTIDEALSKPVDALMLEQAIERARAPRVQQRMVWLEARRLARMRVLLVEDHPVNRHVVREILASEGAEVTIATNGLEALACLRQQGAAFDAVLMDIQMPGMDGYTATREIRERMNLGELPVIAMTANASPEDREHSRSVGMNDHLAKPIDVTSLVASLLRHARGVWLDTPLAVPVETEVAAQVLAVDKALARLAGNRSLYAQMARMFGQEQAESVRQLRQALERQDHEEAARAAHTLKGVAATLGAEVLSEMSAKLERALRKRTGADVIERLAAALEDALEPAIAELARIAAEAGPWEQSRPDAEFDRAAFEDCLDRLVLSLVDSDMVAVDHYSDLRALTAESLAPALQPVADALDRLDFVAALEACRGVEAAVDAFCETGERCE